MARIKRTYWPMYDKGLFGPEWDTEFQFLLELAEEYEGLVPVYVPILQRIPRRGMRSGHRTVFFLVDYDFTVDEVVNIYKMRAPRKGANKEPREEDLDNYDFGIRRYLTWQRIPSRLVEAIKSQIYHQRRVELMSTPIPSGGTQWLT